jgi:hypothetical protein
MVCAGSPAISSANGSFNNFGTSNAWCAARRIATRIAVRLGIFSRMDSSSPPQKQTARATFAPAGKILFVLYFQITPPA